MDIHINKESAGRLLIEVCVFHTVYSFLYLTVERAMEYNTLNLKLVSGFARPQGNYYY